MLAESFFDETNSHKGEERLCVAGYVFLKEAADQQAMRWAALLEKWKLPYFHMVDCAHNVGAFSHLSKADCDLAAREAIRTIKETASTGICITVFESEFLEIVPLITGVAAWIGREKFSGEMHYFFEEGANTSSHASWSIAQMMKDKELRADACYGGHTFIPKIRSPGIQAADILAWHAGQIASEHWLESRCERTLKA